MTSRLLGLQLWSLYLLLPLLDKVGHWPPSLLGSHTLQALLHLPALSLQVAHSTKVLREFPGLPLPPFSTCSMAFLDLITPYLLLVSLPTKSPHFSVLFTKTCPAYSRHSNVSQMNAFWVLLIYYL